MAATAEAARPTTKEGKETSEAQAGAETADKAAAKPGGGLKAWLPLITAVVTMPVLAFATTRFVLLPKMQHSLSQGADASVAPEAPAAPAESATPAKGEGSKGVAGGKTKVMVPMTKMLVNVSGTMGTRYLMTSVTLVGNTPDFKNKIDDNKDQLMDLATSTLSSKTISDLEKPGARNVIRSELLTVLNNALGGSVVQEIYITELAIQ